MIRKLRVAVVASMLVLASACVVAPRPGVVYVRREPPPLRVEAITVSPGRGYVWMRGYWAWHHDDYLWVPGHWVVVPRGYAEWVPGRWTHDRQGWFYVEGHWR